MRNSWNQIYLQVEFASALKSTLWVGLLAMLTLQACTHDPVIPVISDPKEDDFQGTPCDPDVVYFDRDILPILRSNCAKSGCHDAESHQEDIILDNFQNVLASGVVKPFDVSDSELYEVITETDPDKIMPEPPNQGLNADQIALIARWIEQGAKSLSCDAAEGPCITDNISYAEFVAPLLSTNCTGCHSGGTPSGNIVLNSHSAVQTVALNGRLLGAITWTSGYQQMPKGSGKLSDCNIEKIKVWINNGAPNN
jgi:hypothetical protein